MILKFVVVYIIKWENLPTTTTFDLDLQKRKGDFHLWVYFNFGEITNPLNDISLHTIRQCWQVITLVRCLICNIRTLHSWFNQVNWYITWPFIITVYLFLFWSSYPNTGKIIYHCKKLKHFVMVSRKYNVKASNMNTLISIHTCCTLEKSKVIYLVFHILSRSSASIYSWKHSDYQLTNSY